MATKKLYDIDAYATSFEARVESCEKTGQGYMVILDQTLFFPEEGGQTPDKGKINGIEVLDVQIKGDVITHFLGEVMEVGATVKGEIDWEHRFSNMQQHSGEHIVSGMLCSAYHCDNVGFHMGRDVMEIDFDGPIPAEDLGKIETAANEAVWKNLPVRCWYPSPEALPHVGYRTKQALNWPVRIVEIPGYDICACCGVHVGYTGEIGLVKILSCVKFHQGVRLELVCGKRALSYMCRIFEQNRQVSQTFSAQMLETGAVASRVSAQLAAEKFRSAGLEKRIFAMIAQLYLGKENAVHFEPALNPGAVRELADQIARVCSGWAAVYSGTDDTGYCLCIVSPQADVRELGKQATQALNGRGGGKPGCFQGSFQTTKAQIEEFFRFIVPMER